jgi:hypothetical protein
MDLLNRYLQAVKFWLPKGQQEDIAAELREDLQSRIDERQESLGRHLSEAEVAALLKECGRPVVVASRYRPQQSLIGPVLLPIYYLVLKVIALFYLAPWVVVFISLMTFSQNYRASHTVGDAAATLWSIALTLFGAVTITFVILERAQAKSGFLDKWEPIKLPPVRNSRQIKRSSSIAEIVANLIFSLWWLSGWSANAILWPHLQILLAPAWHSIYWGLVLTALANIVFAACNLARPYWTMPRALIRLALDIAGSAFFCWFVKGRVLESITTPQLPADQAAILVNTINLSLAHVFPLTVAITVCIVAIADLPRIFRMRSRDTFPKPQVKPISV